MKIAHLKDREVCTAREKGAAERVVKGLPQRRWIFLNMNEMRH